MNKSNEILVNIQGTQSVTIKWWSYNKSQKELLQKLQKGWNSYMGLPSEFGKFFGICSAIFDSDNSELYDSFGKSFKTAVVVNLNIKDLTVRIDVIKDGELKTTKMDSYEFGKEKTFDFIDETLPSFVVGKVYRTNYYGKIYLFKVNSVDKDYIAATDLINNVVAKYNIHNCTNPEEVKL